MILTVRNTPLLLHPYLREINALYAIFVRVMNYKRRRADLTRTELVVAWIYTGYGYVRDVWFNLTTGTKIFNDPARELMFTARLTRYRLGSNREYAAIAEFLCDEWLDQVDPDGDHC